jgi:prepilin-type N-terminal cleavage/methylation domain-containing protein
MTKVASRAGMTLMEILVSIAILSVLLGIVSASFSTYSRSQAVDKTALKVSSLLTEARSNTLASKSGLQYGVYFDTTRVVMFEGATYAAGAATNKVLAFDSSAQITNVNLVGGGSSVVFDKLTGKTTQYGTTTIALPSDLSKSKMVVVHQTGLVEIK